MGDDCDDSEVDEQVEEYSKFTIPTPFGHPFTALKSHAIQFGLVVGLMAALFSRTDVEFTSNVFIGTTTLDSVSLSLLTLAVLTLYALGFTRIGPFEAPETDESAVGWAQIRRKPHYFLTPMWATYVVVTNLVDLTATYLLL